VFTRVTIDSDESGRRLQRKKGGMRGLVNSKQLCVFEESRAGLRSGASLVLRVSGGIVRGG